MAAGLLTALPIAAQKPTTDISEWNENTSFGQNGANTTTDPDEGGSDNQGGDDLEG